MYFVPHFLNKVGLTFDIRHSINLITTLYLVKFALEMRHLFYSFLSPSLNVSSNTEAT